MRRAKHHSERLNIGTSQTNVLRSSKRNQGDSGEIQMPRLLVGITVNLDPDLLDCINREIYGKTQSEKIRLCVEEGFKLLKR